MTTFTKASLQVLCFAVAATLLGGCMGRHDDQGAGVYLNMESLGLHPNRPTVLTFGAVWCHPCREEIPTMNAAQTEFGDRIQFAGFLVEGGAKGVPSKPVDLGEFKSFEGEEPIYPLLLDSGWSLFDFLRPSEGRRLPLIIFLDVRGRVVRSIQRNLDFSSELRVMLNDFLRGSVGPEPRPDPEETLVLTLEEWSLRPGNEKGSVLYENVKNSWLQGLKGKNFTPMSMPFAAGHITFVARKVGSQDTPKSARWIADKPDSVCGLTVSLNEDGSFRSASGYCDPKP